MDIQDFVDRYSPFIKQNLLSIALGLIGLIFFSYGLIVLIGGSKSASDEVIFEPGDGQVLNSSKTKITVDIEGAVLNPGVYNLSSDSRLKEAIVAAGGLSGDADRDWVSKNLNLAAKLVDGEKIYIPKVGEKTTGITGNLPSKQININKASIEELDRLSGVGIATAQKIINGRPYISIDDLLNDKIVGSKVFEKIKSKITVY